MRYGKLDIILGILSVFVLNSGGKCVKGLFFKGSEGWDKCARNSICILLIINFNFLIVFGIYNHCNSFI